MERLHPFTIITPDESDVDSIRTDCSEESRFTENGHAEEPRNTSSGSTTISTSTLSTFNFENSFANSHCVRKVLTGVVVNGFHPQLCDWKEKSIASHSTNSTPPDSQLVRHHDTNMPMSKRRKLYNSTDATDTEDGCQEVRQEIVSTVARWGNTELKILTSFPHDDKPTALQIYSDVFERSNVAQLIAAPGGRIAACKLVFFIWNSINNHCHEYLNNISSYFIGNEKFSSLFSSFVDTRPSLNTLTAFDVVEPTMIPKLYEIFLIALQGDLIKQHEQGSEDNDTEVQYVSLCVPCIEDFGSKDEQYFITVGFSRLQV